MLYYYYYYYYYYYACSVYFLDLITQNNTVTRQNWKTIQKHPRAKLAVHSVDTTCKRLGKFKSNRLLYVTSEQLAAVIAHNLQLAVLRTDGTTA